MYFDFIFLFSSFVVIFCSSVYLLAYQERKETEKLAAGNYPGVSIVVPMWNEGKTIAATLDSLIQMQNEYKGLMEIIVIDDFSTDNSFAIVEEYTRKYNFIRLFMKDGERGKSESLNQGFRMAKYELVGCVDADSYPEPSALNHVVKEFQDPRVGAVTTKLVVNNPKNWVEWFQHIEYIYSNFILMAIDSLDAVFITRGPLSIYRKDVMMQIGGFLPAHKTPTEDMEITFRIRKAGYKIRGSRDAKVYTSVMTSWKNLFWQRMRWNRGTLINFWMHRDMMLDSRYGMFSIFVFPTSTMMIAMIGVIVLYMLSKTLSALWNHVMALFWTLSYGQIPDIGRAFDSFMNGSYFTTPYHLLLMLAVFLIFFLVNGFGFFESKERFKWKYFITLLATPFVYNPVLLFFWVSAFVLQTTKYSLRWR